MLIRGEGESQPQRIGLEITDPRGRDTLTSKSRVKRYAELTQIESVRSKG